MKLAIESFVSAFIIVVLVMLGVCTISASSDIRNAQNFHAAILSEMEASDCSDAVINNCKEKTVENGYKELIVTETNGLYEVKLSYDYSIPIINELMNHTIIGYAK